MNKSSVSASDISDDINGINTAMEEITRSSGKVRSSSEEFSTLADKLHELVGRFKVK